MHGVPPSGGDTIGNTMGLKQFNAFGVGDAPPAKARTPCGQSESARRIGAVEKLKTAQRVSLVELDGLFASLQHRAFHGEM